MFCAVMVEIAQPDLARTFTYQIPEGMNLSEGMRVLVPFGSRRVEGYVMGVSDTSDVPLERVKQVIRTLEPYPVLLPELIRLGTWMERQYHCLPVEALRLMLPAAMRGERVHIKTERVVRWIGEPKALSEALAATSPRATRRIETLIRLAEGPQPLRTLSRETINVFVEQGLMVVEECEVRRAPTILSYQTEDPVLTADQERVLTELLPALGQGGKFLLCGVTGSGKTEVYIRLAHACLAQKKGVIVLVPEIALTPQMTGWFHTRFGSNAAVLHSRLSAGERFDEWRRIRAGDARVVIGARSAVFAPMENLGAIIIDEAHEQSYRSEQHPCYDAREVAAQRCSLSSAVLLLSSATPALTDFARALHGDFTLLEMPSRVAYRPMPQVELVDMRQEILSGNNGVLSRALVDRMTACLTAGQQAMLLINRRGHSTFVSCRACGYVAKCEQCDVSMTYHMDDPLLRCHYCGVSQRPPKTCPQCGSPYIRYFGAGTQKVEAAVQERFPGAVLLRMDADTTRRKDAHAALLNQFREGEASVLIGTQMIAKGLDFPHVTLVGVVAADATLHLPDYRSAERTFQLVTQVAGRAGRADLPGHVVVQTYDPEHYSLQSACTHDYRSFFEQEIVRRRRGMYPPYTRMVRILYESADADAVAVVCIQQYDEMERFLEERPDLRRQVIRMNAREAPVKWIRGQIRWQLFLKLYTRGPTEEILVKLAQLAEIPNENVRAGLQVDPANLI